jgi:ribosomal protein L16 Arg81 hydroxylase
MLCLGGVRKSAGRSWLDWTDMGIQERRSVTTCRFLDRFTFETLIAPLTFAQFCAQYWEQKPLFAHRGDPNFYDDLMTLEDFDRAIASSPDYVKTAEAKSNKNTRIEAETTPGLERTLAEMRNGATLVLDKLHQREPKLGLLCRLLEQQLGHYFQTNLYLTPSKGQGFTPHWDNHDVFILQVLGSKHWRLEKQARKFPAKDEHMGEHGREFVGEPHVFTLNQGDMVYIPRGFVHAAECGSEPSLHITLGLLPYSWGELLHATIKAAVQDDEHLLHALPLGFLSGNRNELVEGLLSALKKVSENTYLCSVVERFKDDLVTKYPLDVSGQIADFFRATELNIDDVVGPRAGIIYRARPGSNSVRLNFGARTIDFLVLFSEALDFALKTSSYVVRDLPGDLEDEEKLVFIERLIQEGLVVRK